MSKENRKSIAIISNQAFSILNFRKTFIEKLVEFNFSVYALAPDYDDKTREQVKILGASPVDYKFDRTSINPVSDVVNTINLIKILKSLDVDISFGYFIKPVIFGTVAAWLAKIPRRISMIEGLGYVYTVSSEKVNIKRQLLRFLVSLLYKFSLSKSHAVIFLNSDDISEFVSRNLVKLNKVINLGGIGVDLKEWTYSTPHLKPITFLIAARLLKEKGVREFAAAAKIIKNLYPNVKFIILGKLDSNPGSISLDEIDGWVSNGILEWPGHVEVKPWLKETSVFVLPSYREGVPRSTQEAMAIGRAVITTDVPGCRDTVRNGKNGFLIKEKDVEALVQAMISFIKNPALISKMGAESRNMAEELFDATKVNKRLIDVCLGKKNHK